MENAMHDSRRYRDSVAECPLAAQEASQPDYRKLLISMARRMRLWTITFVVIFVSLGSSPALAEDSKPSFLQAAIFLLPAASRLTTYNFYQTARLRSATQSTQSIHQTKLSGLPGTNT
jgi:hypothetical protein